MESRGTPKPWYKKKRYYLILAIFVVISIANLGSDTVSVQPSTQVGSPILSQPLKQAVPDLRGIGKIIDDNQQPTDNSGLSNDNYYTNTYGNKVHSPAYSETIPKGASAKCRDGTYSFSQSRRGTCSHHGGVAKWL